MNNKSLPFGRGESGAAATPIWPNRIHTSLTIYRFFDRQYQIGAPNFSNFEAASFDFLLFFFLKRNLHILFGKKMYNRLIRLFW